MIINLYTIYDKVLGVYGPIIECANDKVLERTCKEQIALDFNNPKNDLVSHSNDLIMYRIASRDTSSGVVVPCDVSQVFLISDIKNSVELELLNREEIKNGRC